MKAIALLLFILPGNHWIKVKDAYHVHQRYLNHYGNMLGEYYQPKKPSWTNDPEPAYTAQCWEGKPAEFATEGQAQQFVLNCPE